MKSSILVLLWPLAVAFRAESYLSKLASVRATTFKPKNGVPDAAPAPVVPKLTGFVHSRMPEAPEPPALVAHAFKSGILWDIEHAAMNFCFCFS